MKNIALCVTLGFFLVLPFLASASSESKWGYEGHFGPENWANFDPDYHACAEGEQQSPIDIVSPLRTSLHEIELHWEMSGWTVHNTGNTIEAVSDDAGYAMIGDERYDLISFHFHTPSEHAFEGLRTDMEAQFVHQAHDGRLAIIAVMLRGGGRHDEFDTIIANAPALQYQINPIPEIDLTKMITDLGDTVRYQGSLTTPPCTENVLWAILTDPLTVSDTAILAFNLFFDMNARPLQDLNRRFVLED